MVDHNEHATTKPSAIRCVEVMISREGLERNAGLFWTLSVYSLENQPVSGSTPIEDSEVFHFMVFDWQRTIRNLLNEHQVTYSILGYFSPRSVFSEVPQDISSVNEAGALKTSSIFLVSPASRNDDLILESGMAD